jgi:acyl carrier protein
MSTFNANFFGGFFMVFDKIREILADQLDANADEMTMDTRIAEDLGADSLDVVEMLMSVEDEFGIEIPDDAIEDLKTIGNVVEYIEKNK